MLKQLLVGGTAVAKNVFLAYEDCRKLEIFEIQTCLGTFALHFFIQLRRKMDSFSFMSLH